MTRALLVLLLAVPAAAEDLVTFTDVEVKRLLQHSPLPPPPPDETNARADDPQAAALGRAPSSTRASRQRAPSPARRATSPSGLTDGLPLAHGEQQGAATHRPFGT
jgi:hypothetical protein